MNATIFTPVSRNLAVFAATAVSAAALVACGAGGPDSPQGGNTIQQQSLTADQKNDNKLAPLGKADSSQKTQAPGASGKLVPTGIRVGSHDQFDRVVIDLQGEGTPGWFTNYTDTATQQASGQPVKVAGQSFLNVNVDGTTYPFEIGVQDQKLEPVKGPGRAVAEVVSSGTFEGRSQFIIGLNTKDAPYSVVFLDNPKRLVIDVMHH
ncbi:hypothetical protein QVA66_05915 [Staphylococcus chromogenes]|nr:hypothetical protein [Staphylococcus chromogenes]